MNEAARNLVLTPSLSLRGVLCLVGSNPYWTGSTMFRLQEFYESKFEELRGQVFAFETAMDLYAKPSGEFDYAASWLGFNVPGYVVEEFFRRYRGLLSAKESHLYGLIQRERPGSRYYLIGTHEGQDPAYLHHELAHAAFYLDGKYQKDMLDLILNMDVEDRRGIEKWFRSEGYHDDDAIFLDEIQAYLSTNTKEESLRTFKFYPHVSKKFVQYYREYFRLDI